MRNCACRLLLAGFLTFGAGCHQPAIEPPSTTARQYADVHSSREEPARLQRTHQALFYVFLPHECLKDNTQLIQEAENLCDTSADAVCESDSMCIALSTLDEIARRSPLVQNKSLKCFADLSPPQRTLLLEKMSNSSDESQRSLAQNLRLRYLHLIYDSKLGLDIAGVPASAEIAPNAAAMVNSLQRQIPLSNLKYDARQKCLLPINGNIDFLIIGSGPAGSVLAHELRNAGRSVVLIERGPLVVPGTMDGRDVSWLMESAGQRTSVDGGIRFSNGQAVGGGSTVNADLAFAPTLPTVRQHIAQWRAQGCIRPDQFQPDRIAAAYEWVRQMIGTRPLGEDAMNENNRILWKGAKLRGLHPSLYAVNTYSPGHSPWPLTDKRSSVDQLLLACICEKQNPLRLLPRCSALRLVFDARKDSAGLMRAVGVDLQFQGDLDKPGVLNDPCRLGIPAHTICRMPAENVIVCAGALGTAAFLLNSHVENPLIGDGIVIHPSLPLIGLFDHPIRALGGTPASVYVADHALDDGYLFEAMSARPFYVAAISFGDPAKVFERVHSFQNIAGFGVMLIDTPDPHNRISLSPTAGALIDYHLSESDKSRFRKGAAEGVRILFAAGARQVFVPTTEDILGDGNSASGLILHHADQADLIEKKLQFNPRLTLLTSAHLQGSAKMGSSSSNSVVSPDFRLWRTSNVYVMDSSVFPTSIGANPMQSIYTFAKIFADQLNDAMSQ